MIVQRNPNTPRVQSVRPITRDDLQRLREPSRRPLLKRLRDSHHNIARLIASGLSREDVAYETGFSLARVSVLAQDPAMQELIAKYRGLATDAWLDSEREHRRRLFAVREKALRHISDHFDAADESNELIPLRQAFSIFADTEDRVGISKKSTNVNVNIDFAAKLEAARRRSAKVIEEKPLEPIDRRI